MSSERVPLPLLAVITLVMLVGHYVLMSADPHAPDISRAVEHDTPAIHCHLPDGAWPASPDSLDAAPLALVQPSWLRVCESRLIVSVAWDSAPGYPPDTWRALLQVFLN